MKSGKGLDYLKKIKFKDYKSFSSGDLHDIYFDKNIALVIGRNNSGKSSIVDVIEQSLSDSEKIYNIGELQYVFTLDDYHISLGFRSDISGSPLDGNHFEYGKKYVNEEFPVRKENGRFTSIYEENEFTTSTTVKDLWDNVANGYSGTLSNVCFRRITAERDISPELESDSEVVETNGIGATNLVRMFLNKNNYDESIVEKKILDELNVIMGQDAKFERIRVQQVSDSIKEGKYKWEIYLVENGKRFALSKSGSGLKTIILVLINLYLIPLTSGYKNKEIIYAFEEVENNLHPALQRRMFEYLYEYSINHNIKIFITSHSHIAINSFYGKESADIYHVLKENSVSSLFKIDSNKEKTNILDDLDVKASDLFQSNGIIWVEGPSDRVYIKQWLKVFTENDIKEGQDYQFAYYGGKLLSHYKASDENVETELINVLRTNRHAAIIIDSDKLKIGAKLNKTKIRVREEFKENGLFCWITQGKEIENYISAEAINRVHNSSMKQIEQYELFPEYIKKYDKNFGSHKVDSSRKYSEHITKENSIDILDLNEQIEKLYNEIKKW